MLRRTVSSVFSVATHHHRLASSQAGQSAGEQHISRVLKNRFPQAKHVEVNDISGGCGSMYQVSIESSEFKGMAKVAQHKAVTACLATEIKDMHGVVINTKALD